MDSGFLAVLTDRMTAYALPLFIQSAAISAVGLAATRAFKLRGPFVQSFALRASVATVLALSLFLLAVVLPAPSLWHVSIPSSSMESFSLSLPSDFLNANISAAQVHPAKLKSQPAEHSDPVSIPKSGAPAETETGAIDWGDILRETVAIVWLVGSILLLGWIVMGRIVLLGLFRAAIRVSDGMLAELTREICEKVEMPAVPLYRSKGITGPFLCGIYRPAIFIPENFEAQLNEQQLRAVLAHEIAHAQRSDNMWRLLGQLCASLLWFQPLVWKTLREMDATSESGCDQLAVNAGCAPVDYADTLLSLASFPQPRLLEQSLGAGAVPEKSRLASRIEELLSFKSLGDNPSTRFRIKVIAALVGVGIIASIAFSVGSIGGESWATRQYLSNFTLPKQLGYEMAPAIPVSYDGAASKQAKPISYLTKEDQAALDRMINLGIANCAYGGQPPVQVLHDAEKELARATPSTKFYAEMLIGLYYYACKDFTKENEYRYRALRDAPMILAGRIQFDDGSPVVGYRFSPDISIRRTANRSDRGSDIPCGQAVTDRNGCFYVPIYPGYMSMTGWMRGFVNDDEIKSLQTPSSKLAEKSDLSLPHFDEQALTLFKSDKRVVILPPMFSRPYIRMNPPFSDPSKPLIVSGSRLKISWTPNPLAAHYSVGLAETIRSGPLTENLPFMYVPNLQNISPSDSSITFDFHSKSPLFFKNKLYNITIVGWDSKGRQCLNSQNYSFRPVNAFEPLELSMASIRQVLPQGYTVEKIERANGVVTISGELPSNANIEFLTDREPFGLKCLGTEYRPRYVRDPYTSFTKEIKTYQIRYALKKQPQ